MLGIRFLWDSKIFVFALFEKVILVWFCNIFYNSGKLGSSYPGKLDVAL